MDKNGREKMELPVYIEGDNVGALRLTQQNGVWRARVRMRNIGRVARLYVFGRGGGVYLGIPEPENDDSMGLSRALKTLPEGAQYCAEQPRTSAPDEAKDEPDAPVPARRHVVWMGGRPYYF